MRMKALFFTLLFFFSFQLLAQSDYHFHSDIEKNVIDQYILEGKTKTLELQLIADENVTTNSLNTYGQTFDMLLIDLKKKKLTAKSDQRFLSWMFYKVHRKALKNYEQYTTLATTLDNGKYDCLSATTLYALLLNELNYKPEVIETNYHIYLFVTTEEGRFLIESTDPITGFVYDEKEIALRTELKELDVNTESTYLFKAQLNSLVTLTKLAGLQYYNKAVFHYNQQDLKSTLNLLEKASLFYHSQRITEFGIVLANAIAVDQTLNQTDKNHAMSRIRSFLKMDDAMASR